MKKLEIRKNAYYDSVTLMIISKEIKKMTGVQEALVGMGTDLNRELAERTGLSVEGFEEVTANDFFVAADCETEEIFADALEKVDEMLNQKTQKSKNDYHPPTLEGAVKIEPELNMAVISVPGRFAAEVARDNLERGINVMLFSDNVTVEEERELKEYAASKELLVMGPDCGTAIINNVPLAFANVVKSGDIGMVCASGTGAQEVSSTIDRLGGGISQLLGTGGRDLKEEIGGIMMHLELNALIEDESTKVIVLVSKPPSPQIAEKILDRAKDAGKPVVVCFIGSASEEIEKYGLYAAVSLEDAAYKAVALSKGTEPVTFKGFEMGEEKAEKLAAAEAGKMADTQKYVRGLYTGGTLCDEAMKLMADRKRTEDIFLDFGDDEFTVGRPHPMIDPSLRAERVVTEAQDKEIAVIMVDCVIGYGSHEDPACDLAEAIRAAKKLAEADGRYLSVVANVCGTEGDPQGRSATQKKLEEAGAIVLPSNAQAARFAQLILSNL